MKSNNLQREWVTLKGPPTREHLLEESLAKTYISLRMGAGHYLYLPRKT